MRKTQAASPAFFFARRGDQGRDREGAESEPRTQVCAISAATVKGSRIRAAHVPVCASLRLSPRERVGVRAAKQQQSRARTRDRSVEYVALVELNFVRAKQSQQLRLEIFHLVMFGLAGASFASPGREENKRDPLPRVPRRAASPPRRSAGGWPSNHLGVVLANRRGARIGRLGDISTLHPK